MNLLHTCSPGCRHDPSKRRARRLSGSSAPIIDFHCHVLTPEVEVLVGGTAQKKAERARQVVVTGEASVHHSERVTGPPAARRMTSIDERLADMDAMGVDRQVMSPSPTQYYYWAEEGLAEQLVRAQNERIAELCASHPDRLSGLGTVALQSPSLAVAQLRHCVKTLGLHGVEISSSANGIEVSDETLAPFWQEVAALDCVVFLHPLGTSLGERVNSHYLANIIGQPLETTIALSKMIFSGLFDRHPGLKLIAAHGGGYLPSYAGRIDHGSQVRPEAGGIRKLPSEYLKSIWFDTVVHDPSILRHLVDTVGACQIVVGTDYPFDMGAYDVHELVDSVPGLSEKERIQILGLNAARLLGLPVR
jgi:aminocarboxymuconate-semialdehyde decarboxylase